MKTRIELEKEFDEKFSPEWWKGFGTTDDIDRKGIEGITDFISSIRQNDVDELIVMFNKLRDKYKEDACVLADYIEYDPINMLRHIERPELRYVVENLMSIERQLSDIITHLKSIKEKI